MLVALGGGGGAHLVDRELRLGELLQLSQIAVIIGAERELEEGALIHLVGRINVGEEPELCAIGEKRDARLGHAEIAIELAVLRVLKAGGEGLGLHNDLDLVF